MHRTISRASRRTLWIVAACHLALTGCYKHDEQASAPRVPAQEAQAMRGEVAPSPATGGVVNAEPMPAEEAEAADESAVYGGVVPAADKAPAPETKAQEREQSSSGRRSRTAPATMAAAPSRPMPAPMKAKKDGLGMGYGQGTGTVMPAEPPPPPGANTEDYRDYGVNPMTATAEDALSTFAVDVDTASFAIARRKIEQGTLPPPASVRVEEFVNYFRYDYAGPGDGRPFAVHMDAAPSPFTPGRHLLRVGVQAKKLSLRERKNAHLVFLVDVSGSMHAPDKLPLAQRALRVLVDNLKDGDTVSLVTYAGSTRVVLEPTGLEKKHLIVNAIQELTAGGSTNMGSGIQLAYDMAARNLSPDSVSRVLVLSDGDANVGNTSHEQILDTIRGHVAEGVTLSTIGFGMGNYKDTLMEQLSNKGNGNYFYIDSQSQARRVFQEQLGGTLEVVAKDVKIQVELDPKAVARYRLVGYENRDVADVDFRNDKVDAGEIGAGHTVTAIYEVELTGQSERLGTVRIRAKEPRGSVAKEHAYPLMREHVRKSFDQASPDFRFATAVMATAEILRQSPEAAAWSLGSVEGIARTASAATTSESMAAERVAFADMVRRIAAMRGGSSVTMAR